MFPLQHLRSWQPFRLDALGIVTLLGAEEVDRAVGRLVSSSWLEYMPLLGAFIIAGDRIADKQGNGHHFYSLSQRIHTTDLSPWFERFVTTQQRDMHRTRTFIRWTLEDPKPRTLQKALAIFLASLACAPLVVLTLLMRDWWGFTNSVALVVSIFVRVMIVRSHTKGIDHRVKDAIEYARAHLHEDQTSKCLLITAESKCVAMSLPALLLRPPSPFITDFAFRNAPAQVIGWTAFAVHVIAIGMSCLVSQIYTVCLLVIPTVLLIWRFGCPDSPWRSRIVERTVSKQTKDSIGDAQRFYTFKRTRTFRIGSYLQADLLQWPDAFEFQSMNNTIRLVDYASGSHLMPSEKRQDLFAWLQPRDEELQSMDKWDFFLICKIMTQIGGLASR